MTDPITIVFTADVDGDTQEDAVFFELTKAEMDKLQNGVPFDGIHISGVDTETPIQDLIMPTFRATDTDGNYTQHFAVKADNAFYDYYGDGQIDHIELIYSSKDNSLVKKVYVDENSTDGQQLVAEYNTGLRDMFDSEDPQHIISINGELHPGRADHQSYLEGYHTPLGVGIKSYDPRTMTVTYMPENLTRK